MASLEEISDIFKDVTAAKETLRNTSLKDIGLFGERLRAVLEKIDAAEGLMAQVAEKLKHSAGQRIPIEYAPKDNSVFDVCGPYTGRWPRCRYLRGRLFSDDQQIFLWEHTVEDISHFCVIKEPA